LDFDYALEWLIVKLDAPSRALDVRSAVVGILPAEEQSENTAARGRRPGLLLIHHESATAVSDRGFSPGDMSRKNNDLNRICRKFRRAETQ
jgi:hypothetical protein